MARTSCFALVTDFGTTDAYVGAVKAVITNLVPDARFIDVSHSVGAQDVGHGAEVLVEVMPYLPRACVVLAVVDPGVGTARRGLAIECSNPQRFLVGPDNGLLWPARAAHGSARVHRLDNPEYRLPRVSPTFHGRDVFAPAAAHLALGVPVERFGERVDDMLELHLPEPVRGERQIAGQILRADHFGNLLSNIPLSALPADVPRERLQVAMGDVVVQGLQVSYGVAAAGTLLATVGGSGRIELAVSGGSAAHRLGYTREASYPLLVRW